MKHLTILLAYGVSEFDSPRGPEAGLALPVKALDADGSVLAEGATSADCPVTLELPDAVDLVFVRLTWPSGRAETQRVSLGSGPRAEVTFTNSRIAPNEWSAWAVPKLNPNTPLATSRADIDLGLDRFENVWLRLWKFEENAWTQEKLKPTATYRNGAAWQLDLSLGQSSWLLQIGGSKVTWRFVALPGGGSARILITPKDSTDPRADALKVIVTSFRSDAEALLEFLARDAMRSVDALAGSKALAQQLYAEKFEDPISAVAGAYYLLRVGSSQRVPLWWYENLSQKFQWLPDGAIIHCVHLLREGSDAQGSTFHPHDLLAQCLNRGWPIYSEGITLLQEAAASLRSDTAAPHPTVFDKVRSLGAAKAWAGAAASFYGRTPDTPGALQWVGMPRAPRRRRLDPALQVRPEKRLGDKESLIEYMGAANPRSRSIGFTGIKPRQVAQRLSDEDFLLGSITQ